ncbi:phosphatase PAP2 family protein [Sulfurimonas aquatica]|uniref:Phosphatase PAP2 family protein n=1 Tax=Sulfurimonas aquatica TaxID=2672570 RepID=A0A975GCM8_9BACT|nr:phosphatase PAP2 family protein [Sulfurimonas aquatica]QSZ41677.1 phosphatase PAP2 family protein [Sulfurimonas aquatica]
MIFSKKQLLIFTLIMSLLIVLSYFTLDRAVSLYFIENADTYKVFGKTVSTLGESHWYIGSAILGALYFGYVKKNSLYTQRFLFLLYANIFSGLVSLVSKMFFGRLRPWKLENGGDGFGFLISQNPDYTLMQNIKYQIDMLIENSTHYSSFPSGHTTTSITVFTVLMLLFPRYVYIWLPITLLGIVSRLLANDHFVSDLLAGTIVGLLSTLYIYSKMKSKVEK